MEINDPSTSVALDAAQEQPICGVVTEAETNPSVEPLVEVAHPGSEPMAEGEAASSAASTSEYDDVIGSLNVPVKHICIVSYKDVKDKITFLMAKGNRQVYANQIDKLFKDIDSLKTKRFINPIVCVSLAQILKVNPSFIAYDKDGKIATPTSENLECYWVIADGQHRYAVALEHNDVDMDVELLDYQSMGNDYNAWVKKSNTFDRNWGNEDLKYSNSMLSFGDDALYKASNQVREILPMSPKAAEYLLTFKKEASRKSDLLQGKSSVVFSKDAAERGEGLGYAWFTIFGNDKKTYKLELVDAFKYVYDCLDDKDHPHYGRNLKCAINRMSAADKAELERLFGDKQWEDLKIKMKALYDNFAGDNNLDFDAVAAEVNEKIASKIMAQQAENAKKIVPIKSGTLFELLANRKAVSEAKNVTKK